MPRVYSMKAFDKLFRHTPVDDLNTLVGLHVVWSDGERVQTRMVDGKIVVPATLPCARCGAMSEEQYLVAYGSEGWTLILNEQGEIIADMDEQVYICDENADEGGIFVNQEEVGFSSALPGLMRMGMRIGMSFIIRTSGMEDGEAAEVNDDTMHLGNAFGGKQPPGWTGGVKGLN